jgi:RNA polymerase sigma-70 factor (ECF subfamily)
MSASLSDERLMNEVGHGKRGALETLVRRYASPLLTFLRRLSGDLHKSEELFQDVFLAVWSKRDQYEYPRPFKPWLYRIALNKCRASYRARPLFTMPLLEEDATESPRTSEPSPVDTAIAVETAEVVSAAVMRLPPQQRLVVVLRVWEQMSYSDIADLVERSQATVRSNMHHALLALRQHLQPYIQ